MKTIDVLRNERACVVRNIKGCDRNCSKCDLLLKDIDIINAYTDAINLVSKRDKGLLIFKDTCGDCKHFTGAGDWDLCCMINKVRLCYDYTEACDGYVKEEK